jgi:hypothetical protein
MRALVRPSVLVVIALILLAACGGGGAGSPTPRASPQASVGTASTEPSAGTASTEPSSEASAAPSSGGGTAAGVCELVTADELAGIFGVAVTTSVIAGPPDTCIVASTVGDPLTAWVLTTVQAKTTFDALTVDPSTVQVPGIGDKAAIVQNTGLLVLKGDSLLTISISGGADMSEDEVLAATKQIGTFAAGRM